MVVRRLAISVVGSMALLASCGKGEEPSRDDSPPSAEERAAEREPRASEKPPPVEAAPCPPELAGCVSATGIIAAVERVDPDGDGDAHFVLADPDSVTLPGITVIDVAVDLRPQPLPKVGEALSGAGLVQQGSYGQRQIEAVEIRVQAPSPQP